MNENRELGNSLHNARIINEQKHFTEIDDVFEITATRSYADYDIRFFYKEHEYVIRCQIQNNYPLTEP